MESLNVIPGAKIAARYISSYNTSGTPTADVSNNHVTYGFYLGSTADGYLRVRLIGAATDVYNASATGYQTLVLQWNPGDTGVSLYINGQYILSNYQGMADTFLYSQTIQFGITSSTPSSNVTDWAQVRFETVPEPSSTAFLGIVGAGLIVWIGFRRSRAAA